MSTSFTGSNAITKFLFSKKCNNYKVRKLHLKTEKQSRQQQSMEQKPGQNDLGHEKAAKLT